MNDIDTRSATAATALVPTPVEYVDVVDDQWAQGQLRCSSEELANLAGSVLPRYSGGFDQYDVLNAGLLGGSGRSRSELEMLLYARALRNYGGDWLSPQSFAVRVQANCLSTSCTSDQWQPPPFVGVRWNDSETAQGRAAWSGRLELTGRSGKVVDERIHRVWAQLMANYRFQLTPLPVSVDTTLTRARGVGDCQAISLLLLEELRMLGVAGEFRAGYLFGGRRCINHYWIEVTDTDGRIKTLDPAMAMLSSRFFDDRYAAFCFGSRVNKLIELATPDGTYAGHPCPRRDRRGFLLVELMPERPASQRSA
ncbi:transglutaminase domain-containing protein [Dactylosporangium sp. NPDC050688]|uniref:transglutaminase domain-containing protein n=1 Tax=Dactylosporangium sp. NPDC050688 TaxID=3157217 RepID=UPI0033EBA58A